MHTYLAKCQLHAQLKASSHMHVHRHFSVVLNLGCLTERETLTRVLADVPAPHPLLRHFAIDLLCVTCKCSGLAIRNR